MDTQPKSGVVSKVLKTSATPPMTMLSAETCGAWNQVSSVECVASGICVPEAFGHYCLS